MEWKMGEMRDQPSSFSLLTGGTSGSAQAAQERHSLTWIGGFYQQIRKSHSLTQRFNLTNCLVSLFSYDCSIWSIVGISILSQAIYFLWILHDISISRSFSLPTNLNHMFWNRNPLVLPFCLMQAIHVCWHYSTLYNLEWPPIMARCSFI